MKIMPGWNDDGYDANADADADAETDAVHFVYI